MASLEDGRQLLAHGHPHRTPLLSARAGSPLVAPAHGAAPMRLIILLSYHFRQRATIVALRRLCEHVLRD